MPDMKKKTMIKYMTVTFAVSWVLQVIASIAANTIEGANGQGIFKGILALCMFIPMVGTLAAKGTLKGLGWVPKLNGKTVKFYLMAWLLPAVTTALGAVLYFLIFPTHFDTTGAYIKMQGEATGTDIMADMAKKGINYEGFVALNIITAFSGTFINALLAVGEEAGWRGFLNPALKERFGKVKGLLLGGVIWGVWHFPVIIIAGYEYGKEYIGAPFAGPVVFCIVTITWGIIADYIYEKTGCIWAAAIFHGSVNAFGILPMIFFEPKLADHMILGPVPVGIISIIPSLAIAAVMLLRNREEVHEKAVAVNNI